MLRRVVRGESAGGVASAPLPRHDRESDVTEHVRREVVGAGLPAKTDRAAELAVPHPPVVARQTRNNGSVGQNDRRTRSFPVDFAGEKERSVALDRRQLVVLHFKTEIVG